VVGAAVAVAAVVVVAAGVLEEAGVADARRHWVYGLHAVLAVLERAPERILELMLTETREDARMRLLRERATALGVLVQASSNEALGRLVGEVAHQGAAAAVRPLQGLEEAGLMNLLDSIGGEPLLLVLDGVTDPHNLGACLRTADAAGVHAVIIPRDRSAGIDGVVRKVAAGAAEFVPVATVTNLARTLQALQARGIWVVGADGEAAQSLHAADLRGPLALVLGAEGSGMRRLTRERCDFLVSIPMAGSVESLNVSVAAGVVLFEARRQRGPAAG
jgi:23S rRNA (guanosine2251-2'-O)-methyltransferase